MNKTFGLLLIIFSVLNSLWFVFVSLVSRATVPGADLHILVAVLLCLSAIYLGICFLMGKKVALFLKVYSVILFIIYSLPVLVITVAFVFVIFEAIYFRMIS